MYLAVEMVVRTIQKSHRISIPPEIWRSLGLREGDEVEIIRNGGRITILPAFGSSNPTETLWGLSKKPTPTDEPDEVIAEAMAERAEDGMKEKIR